MKNIDFKFFKEAGLLSASNLLNSASNGLIIVFLNRYLSNNESGSFLYILSIASPLFIFISFDLRRKVTAHQLDNLTIKEVFSARNVLAIFGLLLFVGICAFSTDKTPVFILAICAIGIGKIFDSITEINYAIFQFHNRENNIFISRLIKVFICGLAFIVLPSKNYISIFSLYALSNIVPFAFFDFWVLKKLSPDIKLFDLSIPFSTLWKFMQMNIGLAIASLIMTLSPNVPTYFVKYYMDLESVTYFSSINFIISTLYIAGSGLGYALLKKLSKPGAVQDKQKLSLIIRSSLTSFATYSLFGFAFYLIDGMTLLFNNTYSNYYLLYALLLLSGCLYTISSYLNNYLLHTNSRGVVLQLRIVRIVLITLSCAVLPIYYKSINVFGYCLVLTNLIDCFAHAYFVFIKHQQSVSKINEEKVLSF